MSMLASPCPNHPLQRVVGVCGSCLKDRLTFLTSAHVGSLDSPECSHADVDQFASTSSSIQVEKDEGEAPQAFTNQEIDEGSSVDQETANTGESAKEQEIKVDWDIIHQGISINQEIIAGGYAEKPYTKWRSNSPSERGDLFGETAHGPASASKEGQACAKKVTLRALFAMDDEEQLKINDKEEAYIINNIAAHGEGVQVAYKDECRRSVSKKLGINEQKSNTPTSKSYGCVSSSSSSSAYCPAVRERIKHSLWFSSLLCRKRREGRVIKGGSSPGINTTSQVACEVRRMSPSGISADAGGIRANSLTGIRGHERRWRSKEINTGAISSIRQSSQWPTRGALSVVDSRSERKFNLTARKLAFDFPSILPSGEPAPAVMPSSSQTCNDDHTVETENELRPAAQGTPNFRPTAQEQAARITMDPLTTAITTATEFLPTGHLVAGNATLSYCRSLSCNSSTSTPAYRHGRHHEQKLPEYRMWEPYYSPGRTNKANKLTATSGTAIPPSGRGAADATRYCSRTVKISPSTSEHSGLLRFYLTPLRSSGRTRFSSGRRPPKRGVWSLFFLPK